MTFERVVQPVHDRVTGKLLHYEIVVGFNLGTMADVQPGQKVRVTVEKWKRPK